MWTFTEYVADTMSAIQLCDGMINFRDVKSKYWVGVSLEVIDYIVKTADVINPQMALLCIVSMHP